MRVAQTKDTSKNFLGRRTNLCKGLELSETMGYSSGSGVLGEEDGENGIEVGTQNA